MKKQKGLSLFEIGILAAVSAAIVAFFLHKVEYYEEQSEKVVVEQTIHIIRIAVKFKIALLDIQQKEYDRPSLIKQNPIEWLKQKPQGYRGEFTAAEQPKINPNEWYFDKDTKEVVYVVNRTKHLEIESRHETYDRLGHTLLRFSLVKDGQSIAFEPVYLYRWFSNEQD